MFSFSWLWKRNTLVQSAATPRASRRRTTLAVEPLEDRLVMSAVGAPFPGPPVYDNQLQLEIAQKLDKLRVGMNNYSTGMSGELKYEKRDGYLVIHGSNVRDDVEVQEYPAGPGRPTPEYFVNAGPTKKWRIPVGDVPGRRIYFFGGGGNDSFRLQPIADFGTQVYADGGPGADQLTGGLHKDFLDGGRDFEEKDTLDGAQGDDFLAGGPGGDLMYGRSGDDKLVGEAGVNTMNGGNDNDDLFGGNDVDKMYGESGVDRLFGGHGEDIMNGGANQDYLDGGADFDYLVGGSDKVIDTLIGRPGPDHFGASQKPYDSCPDYTPSDGDYGLPPAHASLRKAPTAAELLNNRKVQQALADAWAASRSGTPQFHEEGGWIYMDTTTEEISVLRATSGGPDEIDLWWPPVVDGSVVVATFHTHPTSPNHFPDIPSSNDTDNAWKRGVPNLIHSQNRGDFVTGPDSRRNGLTGDLGFVQFPPFPS
jgi:hypothetical protein